MTNEPEPKKEEAEDRKTRFNMDMAHQELIHETLKDTARASKIGELEIYFRSLKQVLIMIEASMEKTDVKSHEEMQKTVQTTLNTFVNLNSICGISYDYDLNRYSFGSEEGSIRFNKLSDKYYKVKGRLEQQLDFWQVELRRVMVGLGLFMLKDKGGLDATT